VVASVIIYYRVRDFIGSVLVSVHSISVTAITTLVVLVLHRYTTITIHADLMDQTAERGQLIIIIFD